MTAINPAAARLRTDLAKLKKDVAAEKKDLASLDAVQKKIVDSFTANPQLGTLGKVVGELLAMATVRGVVKSLDDAIIKRDQAAVARDRAALHQPSHPAPRPPGHHPAPKPPAHHPAPKPPTHPSQTWKPGPGHLAGADTSHYQSDATFERSIRGAKFTCIKATEGTGYVDPTFRRRWNELGAKIKAGTMKLRVAYHFMRPGNGVGQAKFFLNSLGIHGKLAAGTRLALDWESSSLRDPKALRDAANYIHGVTGLWPLIYTSASQVSRARAAVPNAPMWEAKWSGPAPTNVPFVQTSDGPGFDHDVFNGDLAALERFAGFRA